MNDYEKFVAGIMTTAFFVKEEEPKRRTRRRKKHRLVRAAEDLPDGQLEKLLALLEGDAVLCTVRSTTYVVQKCAVGWSIVSVDRAAEEHTVSADLASCSCPDHRFRGGECKHMEALKKVLK